MIKDTLIALLRAGDDALAAMRPGAPAPARVVHTPRCEVRQPHGVVVSVRNGPLDRVFIGADDRLVQSANGRFAAGFDVFAQALASRAPTPRTIVSWRRHEDGAPLPGLEGPRCFALHLGDHRGALDLVTEIFSRGAYEAARTNAYEEEVARHYLPADLAACPTLTRENDVVAALAVASRLELDLCCSFDGAEPLAARGLLLARQRAPEGGAAFLSLDIDEPQWSRLEPERPLGVCFGLCGRVFQFRSRVVDVGSVALARDVSMRAVTVAMPRVIEISQRRREFRIAPPATIECRLRPADPPTPDEDEYGFPIRSIPDDAVAVSLVDLSFSGAGLLGEPELLDAFTTGDLLEFWVNLSDRSGPLRLRAAVRQATPVLTGRNRRQGRLGIEFQPANESERRAREIIEHHVMTIERQLACERASAAERFLV